VDIQVIRSKRRTLALEITRDGRLLVRAPIRASQKAIEQFVAAHRGWIAKHLAIVEERKMRHPEPTPEEETALRRAAAAYLPRRTAELSALMGASYTNVKINFARTRFGSCNAKNGINFSARLMRYSPRAIDYVIIHELAHTWEHNHSPRFWQIVARFMPDYKEVEKELKS